MKDRSHFAAVLVTSFFLAGCSGSDNLGSDAEGPEFDEGITTEEGAVDFNPDDFDETNYFDASFADFTVDELDPTVVEPCDLLPADTIEEYGLTEDTSEATLVDKPGCRWSGGGHQAAVFVDHRAASDRADALSIVLLPGTMEREEEAMELEVVSVSGYPAHWSMLKTPDGDLPPVPCGMRLAVADEYVLEMQIGTPPDPCVDATNEIAAAVIENLLAES